MRLRPSRPRPRLAVKRIMDELKGIPQARSTPFYPLGIGAKWVYAADYTDNPDLKTPDITVEVKEPAKADDLAYFRLTEDIGYGTQTSKLVAVRHDGVYRRSDFTKDVQIERLFALPPASGTTWTDGKYTYGLLKATEVTVPAGTYKNVWIVEKTEGGKTVERSWFAENVGVVKVETPIAGKGGKKVLSLKSYTQPK